MTDADKKTLGNKLIELLDQYGAEQLLSKLGEILQDMEGAGEAYNVGCALVALSNVEW